ncbi:hypothetical protein D3C86_1423630 [compost metagenome]
MPPEATKARRRSVVGPSAKAARGLTTTRTSAVSAGLVETVKSEPRADLSAASALPTVVEPKGWASFSKTTTGLLLWRARARLPRATSAPFSETCWVSEVWSPLRMLRAWVPAPRPSRVKRPSAPEKVQLSSAVMRAPSRGPLGPVIVPLMLPAWGESSTFCSRGVLGSTVRPVTRRVA